LTGIVSLPIGTPHTPLRFHLTPSPPPTPSLCRFSFSVSSSWLAFVLLLHLTLHTARHSIHFNDDLPHPRSLPLPKGLRAEPQVRSTWRPSLCLWGTACPASIVDPNWHSRHPPSIPFLLPFPPVAVSLTLRNETISVAPSPKPEKDTGLAPSPPASNPASYPIQSLRLSSRFMYRHFFALLQGSVSVSAPPPSFLPHTSHSVRAPSVSLTGSYPDGSGSPPFSVVGYAPLPAPLLSLYLLSFRSFSFQRPPALLSSHRPSATTRAIRSEAPQWHTSLSTALSSPAAPQSTALSNQPVSSLFFPGRILPFI